ELITMDTALVWHPNPENLSPPKVENSLHTKEKTPQGPNLEGNLVGKSPLSHTRTRSKRPGQEKQMMEEEN
ncbi:hypothetical protein CHARACLAT_025277, partial [Characodon lateralis]|nr:hypothetical protein [Characodon lateralis]